MKKQTIVISEIMTMKVVKNGFGIYFVTIYVEVDKSFKSDVMLFNSPNEIHDEFSYLLGDKKIEI